MSPTARTSKQRRLVAIDCETNGLFGNVCILALAMVELRNGIAYNSRLWVMNPGNVPMDPGALAVNGLTAEVLESALSFPEHISEIRTWLSAKRGERLTLVGHKVEFDARQLLGEFNRLGEALPPLDLLDTRSLAEEAGVRPAGTSLQDLLDALGLANSAPHTALGDALATASAALVMIGGIKKRGSGKLGGAMDRLAVPYTGKVEKQLGRVRPTAALSSNHIKAHLVDLGDEKRRTRALNVCVREDCLYLATRIEDGIVTASNAAEVVDWALSWLQDYELPRGTSGQLLRGTGRALRASNDPDYALGIYRQQLVPLLEEFRSCGHRLDERCTPCCNRESTCDFEVVVRDVVDAVLFDNSKSYAQPNLKRVEEFLPGYDPKVSRNRGRPTEGIYGELRRNGHFDAAGYGIFVVAEVRRVKGGRPWAHALLNKAWRDGSRNPQLTEMFASMVVVDGVVDGSVPADPKAPVATAISYIEQCLAEHKGRRGRIFEALAKRLTRLRAQRDAPPRPPRDPDKAVNLRAPHRTMLAQPPTNAAMPGKPVKKRGPGRPKGQKTRVRVSEGRKSVHRTA